MPRPAVFKEGTTVQVNTASRPGFLYKRGKVILVLNERYQVKFPDHARPLWFDYEELCRPRPTPAEIAAKEKVAAAEAKETLSPKAKALVRKVAKAPAKVKAKRPVKTKAVRKVSTKSVIAAKSRRKTVKKPVKKGRR